ncbi:tetratricopeptide repeat protein [Uliginosibacterium sp. H3]|uniref:Tetratricopeptide repeat protein n=1 Tax=Uliginosibacterium silvisoli TaxID=3114758 RepID=A0ABU6K5P4_9RHOO|nr:tetratricopeptide repeat protein [Uliginosibacterium sp. H3]
MTTQTPTEETPATATLDEALAYALELQQQLRLDGAQLIYERILEVAPEHPDVLHFLGVLMHQRGRVDEAIALIARAIALIPDHVPCHINMGNVLAESGRLDEAVAEYLRALSLVPDQADVHNNLGVLHKLQRKWLEAESYYRRAIEIDPKHVSAYNNMGLLFAAQGKIKEAVEYYCRSIAEMPGNPDSRRLLGIAYYTLGRTAEAAEVFRQWLEESPEDPVAKHMHAACSGKDVPVRAADDYIEHTFDRFADSFEAQLQQRLEYKAPEIVAEALQSALQASSAQLDILDAGCGTGLCGPLLKPFARHMIGVDLSAGMLAKAEAKQCYDLLEKAELTAYIAARQAAFDAIVSADTIVYFGALDEVLHASHAAMRKGGLLIFTVEKGEGKVPEDIGFAINPHGRYAHTQTYLRGSLTKAGLSVDAINEVVLRNEGGEPVIGWVVTARKSA